MDAMTHPIVLKETNNPAILAAEELHSHDIIDEVLSHDDVDRVSEQLRIEVDEFLGNLSDSTKSPETSLDDVDTKSDTSTSSGDSVKILIATAVKRPQVPEGWNKMLVQMSTPRTTIDETRSLPSPNVSLIYSTPSKEKASFRTSISADSAQNTKAVLSPYMTTAAGEKRAILALIPQPAVANLAEDTLNVSAVTGLNATHPDLTNATVVTSTPNIRYAKPNVFPFSSSPYQSYRTTILKLTNLPWSATVDEVVNWLGNGIERALVPQETQIVSVHILCDRFKGRTKSPAYVELTSVKLAQLIMTKKGMKEMQGRKIKITQTTRKTLLSEIFPTWSQLQLSNVEGVPIVSNFELEGLLALCKLRTPFAIQIPERPYMNILSIAAKYPWKARDMLNPESEEQLRVLQTVREAHKLLNQYGKRLSNYEKIRMLFIQFLESHGGVTGSLRPIPVDPSICPLPRDTSFYEDSFEKRRFNTSFFRDVEIETSAAPPPSLAASASSESGSPPISSDSSGFSKVLENGKAQLEAALLAQREYARQDLESIKDFVTPETTPERKPPSVQTLTSAPVKKSPTVHFYKDYRTPDRNLITAKTLRETNQAYDRAQKGRKMLEPIKEENSQTGQSKSNALKRETSSIMSMESQLSNMGVSTASSPLTIEKTHRIESFFTPPKYSIPAMRKNKANSSNEKTEDSRESSYSAEEQHSRIEDSFEKQYGVPKDKVRELLRNLLASS